jgi:hypothetical protein
VPADERILVSFPPTDLLERQVRGGIGKRRTDCGVFFRSLGLIIKRRIKQRSLHRVQERFKKITRRRNTVGGNAVQKVVEFAYRV